MHILDSIACLVICLFILKAAIQIFLDAIKKMTDEACDDKTQTEITDYIKSCEGVKNLDSLLTRMFGNRIYVIAEIACEPDLPLFKAHEIAEAVHEGIEMNFPLVKHVTVHVNPYYERKEEEPDGEFEKQAEEDATLQSTKNEEKSDNKE